MGGRGTYAAGNDVPYTYETVGKIGNIKILRGLDGKHGLPEEAHTSYAYGSLNYDGTLRTLRFYDREHNLRYEIAKHPEKSIDSSGKPILHYHAYDPSVVGKSWHPQATKASKAMRKRYGKLFERKWK